MDREPFHVVDLIAHVGEDQLRAVDQRARAILAMAIRRRRIATPRAR